MSTRRLNDDPRLTAYALGELEPAEVREVEALLAEDAQARAAVQEIRATASRLTEALRNEAAGVVAAAARRAVSRRGAGTHRANPRRPNSVGSSARRGPCTTRGLSSWRYLTELHHDGLRRLVMQTLLQWLVPQLPQPVDQAEERDELRRKALHCPPLE